MKMRQTPATRNCIGCGKSFMFQWYKQFCGEKCRTASRAVILKTRNQKIGTHKCINCSEEFRAKFTRKYCSKKCSNDYWRKKRNALKQLKEIGEYIGGKKHLGY